MHKQLQSRALGLTPGRAAELSWALAGDMDSLGFPSKGFSDVYKDNMDTTGCVSGSPYTSGSSWEQSARVQYKHRYSHERNLQYLSIAHTFCPLPDAFGQEFRLTRTRECNEIFLCNHSNEGRNAYSTVT